MEASENFYGHGGASEHRTCGTRAFCYGCSLSCYPSTEPGLPCPCCQNALDARAVGSGVVPDSDDEVQPLGLTVTGGNPDGPYNVLGYPDDPTPRRCPRCNSPSPALHPAVQSEGEVQPCGHSFHFVTRAVGSGVVPDKPALACGDCGAPCSETVCPGFNVVHVPAVTDDEAATLDHRDVWFIRDALACYNVTGDAKAQRDRILAVLRSAGFLLVRDHGEVT